MSNLPPEPVDPPRVPDSVDWDAFLGGRAQGEDTPAAEPVPAAAPVTALPSRRAIRDSHIGGTRSSRRTQLAPPREKRSRKGAWGCLVVLLVLAGLVAGAAVFLQAPIAQLVATVQGPADYAGTGTKKVVFMIHDGETGQDIAQSLADQDVVKSFDAFYGLLLKESPAPVFQPGAYQLSAKMSARAALGALVDPANKLKQTVVVPEGTAAVDVLQLISEGTSLPLADLTAAAADRATFGLPGEATTLEGFLFPATYTFPPGVSAHDAVKTLVDRQFKALDSAGVAPADRWRTVVLASLIQREAGLAPDYYKVSRVFLNRLDPAKWASGLLQSDATVAYGTGKTNLVTTTDAERADTGNTYNTYLHPGLPAGPISNPGDLAIDAALHPADGSWLFFVTWNLDTGETIFSTTADEHAAAVVKWQSWMKEHPEYG
ncbi:endolytic transglycosylase MltG [Cryobacterium algoritolerans]|uniref:Endolytic murein transglycosylase n=1 Tax=Cryobacterium algoritolerans TaxID=1259184 RepID=A0A4R8WSM4_9MICO|nr:endolytic transglycosylase MltG [Cryobacterium algoritolerans]TFC15376.1 endolytic transglycosylase MltG [Cryobacterium algoritolerans]